MERERERQEVGSRKRGGGITGFQGHALTPDFLLC